MANYQELLSTAIAGLSENNGAARREVYERARKALVAQLRSINPPLAAREITQHRLELEDCIRTVEQKATEEILGGLRQLDDPFATPEPEAPVVRSQEEAGDSVLEPQPLAEPAAPPPVTPAPQESAPLESAPLESAPAEPAPVQLAQVEAAPSAPAETEAKPDEPSAVVADEPKAAPVAEAPKIEEPKPVAVPEAVAPEVSEASGADAKSIDEIIARASSANRDAQATNPTKTAKIDPPAAVAKAAAVVAAATPDIVSAAEDKPAAPKADAVKPAEVPSDEPVVEDVPESNSGVGVPSSVSVDPRVKKPDAAEIIQNLQAEVGDEAVAADIGTAMSEVREVELEESLSQPLNDPEETEAQSAVDRAIQMLDREARGEPDAEENTASTVSEDAADMVAKLAESPAVSDKSDALIASRSGDTGLNSSAQIEGENSFVSSDDDESGGNALTIFLVIALVLLLGVGGGGYWAWREGYIPLDDLFAASDDAATVAESGDQTAVVEDGPGNTATTEPEEQATEEVPVVRDVTNDDDRLVASDPVPDAAETNDDRLGADTTQPADPAIDTAAEGTEVAAGVAQSLLLEASSDGRTGAVPFSGTVGWSRGEDELGEPTLVGTASIPARNIGVDVLIRRNSDPTLPASHLVEIEFTTSDSFIGGSIASFVGILFKNEELVPGRSLVGAPARIFENMFLFALSGTEEDLRTNVPLMVDNKWMDLALVYGTGRQAIVTLEKDAEAQALFEEVFAAWEAAS